MSARQFILPIAHELIVDLFAGGGGASTGIEQATGRHVDIAINHDPEAVALHQANHPQTRHFISDVFEVDPIQVTDGQPVGLLWASPDCKHFSKAKGGKPVSKKVRSLAWVVVKWAKLVKPRVICLENVEEFQTWGPLAEDGRPCPKRKGETFAIWKKQLENLGYQVEHRELRASDYGTPTIRKRLFLVARCDGLPIVWPAVTHGNPALATSKGLKPWATAADCIDWSIPAPSIFERTRPLADATLRRIAKGIVRYVIDAEKPFIVNTANSKTTGRGPNNWPIEEPLRTVTASPGFAVAVPLIAGVGGRAGQSPERPLDKPMGTITAKGDAALVVPSLAPFITEHANASTQRTFAPDEPLRTQCANVKGGHFALVVPSLLVNTTGHPGSAADEPVRTVTTGGHHGLVSAMLAKHYGGVVGTGVDVPTGTVTTADHHSLVTATLESANGCDFSSEGAGEGWLDRGQTGWDDLEVGQARLSAARHSDYTEACERVAKNGYLIVKLEWMGKTYLASAHRAVVDILMGGLVESMDVNHKDGCKSNNRPENLEQVTRGQNHAHAHQTGLRDASTAIAKGWITRRKSKPS